MEHEDNSPHENHEHSEHYESHEAPHKKKNMTEKLRTNPWIISTFVLGILAIILIIGSLPGMGITGNVISEDEAVELVLDFVESQVGGEVELIGVSSESGLYKITIFFQDSEVPLYVTKDGKNLVQGLLPLSLPESEEEMIIEEAEPILECVEPYGLTQDTIIFYYSNSCGWCSKMKPGVEALEKEGYKFYWIEGSDAETSGLIDDCVRSYMTSGGVPQFICPKTNEIHVGAFSDENSDLDQLALKEWVDNCIA